MTIRSATSADAAVIASILNASIRAQDSLMIETPVTAEDIAAEMTGFSAREGYLVLDVEGVVVGWGVLKRYSRRSGYRFAGETSVYLRRDRRGRGHGTRLQRALLDLAREHGYHHLVAKIWASNAASIAMHEKLGFEVVGIQREIGYVDGRWRDVAIMQCLLEAA